MTVVYFVVLFDGDITFGVTGISQTLLDGVMMPTERSKVSYLAG